MDSMCDACAAVRALSDSYNEKLTDKNPLTLKPTLDNGDVVVVSNFVSNLHHRACSCCFLELKQYGALNNVVQGLLQTYIEQVKLLPSRQWGSEERAVVTGGGDTGDVCSSEDSCLWTVDQLERLLHLVVKVLQPQFPPYLAFKHVLPSALRPTDDGGVGPGSEAGHQEPTAMPGGAAVYSLYCDVHDPEVSEFVLRNVYYFCENGGLQAATVAFRGKTPSTLPLVLAHALLASVSNLKVWLNYRTIVQLLVPLRSAILKYMCKFSDADLKSASSRSMSDFMWSSIKDPLDAPLTFDRDGLELAFKFFNSCTLTMRLAGIAQINNHVSIFNELCNGDNVVEAESMGLQLAGWLVQNQMVEQLFGPNLHVEVVKQSHIVLGFLAVEGRLSNEHIDLIFQASQLKHCSKQVYDIMAPLIKNLEAEPVLHLYSLLQKMEPRDHTEQSLYLASVLIKFIWSNGGGAYSSVLDSAVKSLTSAAAAVSAAAPSAGALGAMTPAAPSQPPAGSRPGSGGKTTEEDGGAGGDVSSSENSIGCVDASDDEVELDDMARVSARIRAASGVAANSSIIAAGGALTGDIPSPVFALTAADHSPVVSGIRSAENSPALSGVRSAETSPALSGIRSADGGLNAPTPDPQTQLADDEADTTDEAIVEGAAMNPARADGLADPSVPLSVRTTSAADIHLPVGRKRVMDCSYPDLSGRETTEESSECDEDAEDAAAGHRLLLAASPGVAAHHLHQQRHHRHRAAAVAAKRFRLAQPSPPPGSAGDAAAAAALVVAAAVSPHRRLLAVQPVTGLGLVTVALPPSAQSPSISSPGSQLDAADSPLIIEPADKLKTSLLKNELQQFKLQQIRGLSDDEDSCSSRMSVKSEKNMADFLGEDSLLYEEELVQLALQAHHSQLPHHLASMASMYQTRFGAVPPTAAVAAGPSVKTRRGSSAAASAGQQLFARFSADAVCRPGYTLLWDLLQDGRVNEMSEGMAIECEKILSNLLCYNSDRLVRRKFIEGCLQKLAQGSSVLVVLRLLPKLFASFQQFRGLDTHQVTLWAEREHCMMQHFFSNLQRVSAAVGAAMTPTAARRNASGSSADCSVQQLQPPGLRPVEVQVRLHFLSTVFCSLGSPDHFRLSVEQMDILWSCLANDPRCSEDLFSWMLSQVRSKDQHALGMDSLRHLLTAKLPSLRPEEMGMTALNLYQQLYQLLRLAGAPLGDTEATGMDHLWKIALRANDTDVSLASIQYLNSCYVSGRADRERQFVERCMRELAAAGEELSAAAAAAGGEELSAPAAGGEDACLLPIQRGLLLLGKHLQTYKRRYAYQLRCWLLEGDGVVSHAQLVGDTSCSSAAAGGLQRLNILLQPAGLAEKRMVRLPANSYVAELRAEAHAFWRQLQLSRLAAAGGCVTEAHLPTTCANLRLISQGTELTPEFDEKTLADVGFKDMQLVFTSVGVPRPTRHLVDACGTMIVSDVAPARESVPMLLLLQERHFSQLLQLMQKLSALRTQTGAPHTKAQVLSRRVWDILMALPTAPQLRDGFNNLTATSAVADVHVQPPSDSGELLMRQLLDPSMPQKLMYALYLVASLCANSRDKDDDGETELCSTDRVEWKHKFIESGGLKHLNQILMSGVLQCGDLTEHWDEWSQDCLACLLQVIAQLATVPPSSSSTSPPPPPASTTSPPPLSASPAHLRLTVDAPSGHRKKTRRTLLSAGAASATRKQLDRYAVLKLSETALCTLDLEPLAGRLCSVLQDASLPRDPNHYRTGFWGRAQVVHYALGLLVSLCYSSPDVSGDAIYRCPQYPAWIRRLLLEDPEPAVRRETADGLHRLCLGHADDSVVTSADSSSTAVIHPFLVPILRELLEFLPVAEAMKMSPSSSTPGGVNEMSSGAASFSSPSPATGGYLTTTVSSTSTPSSSCDDPISSSTTTASSSALSATAKDPYGPSCREFFALACRLLDGVGELAPSAAAAEELRLVELACRVGESVARRDYRERRHRSLPDEGLVGLLRLGTAIVRQAPAFKQHEYSQQLILQLFESLFALPTPRARQLPLCKSSDARSAGLDLLLELVTGSQANYRRLLGPLGQLTGPQEGSPYPWDYWPHEDGRSDCGYVGLTNLGATCYMASCMQHLFMMPQARASILQASVDGSCQHETTLHELQRMFAYLLESERKAYSPRSFCKVYTMDHRPLNTGEQKDMAEFFIDLVSKLEDMTPSLKHLIKQLFCGQITNNVVSLDCGHVSRTCEEFYTVRCQVADMRSLYDSLDEVTVKDTLDGDNMYTCSQCQKKVRAEKRACFKRLPHILCFNTMRYTFNMNTMMREKVNTLFSFPLHLDMSGYLERNLMSTTNCDSSSAAGAGDGDATERRRPDPDGGELFEYALIGVTVHTGTADGGHYYSFIRDRTAPATARHSWLFFNDAEVRPFDPSQLAAECFGGEMTSKTYDSITDKFLDFSFEKTNSAYMLFYERCVTPANGSKRAESAMDESSSDSAAETITPSSSSATDPEDSRHRRSSACEQAATTCSSADLVETPPNLSPLEVPSLELNSELEQWIWKDNMEFLRDKNMFDHSFFSFMWQVCGYVPQTLPRSEEVTLVAARLSTTFFLEIFIHAKEKPTMVQWVELLTKQFNASQAACEWFLDHMAGDDWWPVQILIKCPNQMVRQMLQRLCIHVVQKLRPSHCCRYLVSSERYDRMSSSPAIANSDEESVATASLQHSIQHPLQQLGDASCVTRFVKKLISLMEHNGKSHQRNLTEYFAFLLEFARMGDVEVKFLLSTNCISTMVNFYLCQLAENGEELSDADDDDELDTTSVPGASAAGGDTPTSHQHAPHHRGGATSGGQNKFRPASLEKMISLVALLVDKSRGVASVATIGGASVADDPRLLSLSPADLAAVAGGKGFPFLCHQIRDGLNVRASCSLLLALCRWNEPLATLLVAMLFQAIIKYPESCQSFFRLLSLLLENDPTTTSSTHASVAASASLSPSSSPAASSAGLPCFTQMALPHVWQVAELCPQATLEWLAAQVPRNKMAHCWVIQHLDTWCEHYLLAHSQFRVRAAASYLLVSLVPSSQFRHLFTQRQRQPSELTLPSDSLAILHQVYLYLLRLLKPARAFSDIQHHGNMKLVQYFQLLQYCVVSRAEKLMFSPYTSDLWTLFHPKLSEPSTATHHNKQALLMFWCTVCLDCPENVQLIVSNPHITKNIAFNYILADHDDEQVVLFNRSTLPAYYGLLRLCCSQSRAFTRQLAGHQNLQWAFKNITPYPAQYSAAIDELFKLMALFSLVHPDSGEQEMRDIVAFKRQTIQMYLQVLDARCSWSTLISALKLLADTAPERLFAVYNGALPLLCEALGTLHSMYHEATACHVLAELTELVRLVTEALRCCKTYRDNKEARQALVSCKDRQEMVRKLATLLNSFTPPDLRLACIDALKELVVLLPHDTLPVLTPLMLHSHAGLKELGDGVPLGPFFPRPPPSTSSPGSSATQRRPSPMTSVSSATYVRPPRPLLQMAVPTRLNLQANKCERDEYERALLEHFLPYHVLADLMCRVAINQDLMSEPLASLSALLGAEAVPLQLAHFPKLWIDVHHTKTMEKHIGRLLSCGYLTEYMERVLTIARPSLHNSVIHKFFSLFLNKVPSAVRPGGPVQTQLPQLGDQICCDLSELCLTATGTSSCSLSTSTSSTAEPVLVVRLTADLRALSLVYHAAPPSQPPSAVIRALQTAAARVTAANITDTESASVGATSSSSGSAVEAVEDRPTSSCPPEDEKQSSDGRVGEVAAVTSCPREDSGPSSSARPAEDGVCDEDQRHPAGGDVEETPSSRGGRVSVMELCSEPPSRPSAPQHAHPHPPSHSDWRVPLGRLLHQLVELLVPSKASEQR